MPKRQSTMVHLQDQGLKILTTQKIQDLEFTINNLTAFKPLRVFLKTLAEQIKNYCQYD